jgi:hypothetical protein
VNKLSEDLRIGILGATAGLFSSSITLLIARIDTYYTYLSRLHEGTYDAYERVDRLEWIPISVWHIILSVVASLLIHRYLTNHLRSPFLLWQLIGMTSLSGWVLTAFLVVSMRCVIEGDLSCLQYLIKPDDALLIAKYAATVSTCNVLYASVISASSRQYLAQLDSEAALNLASKVRIALGSGQYRER